MDNFPNPQPMVTPTAFSILPPWAQLSLVQCGVFPTSVSQVDRTACGHWLIELHDGRFFTAGLHSERVQPLCP